MATDATQVFDFTIEDLYDAGLVSRRVPFTITPNEIVAEYAGLCWKRPLLRRDRERDALVRLAIVRPDLAERSLGPGWRSAPGGGLIPFRFWWAMATDQWFCEVFVVDGLVDRVCADARTSRTTAPIPTELDDALSRARLIAAAYLRVRASATKTEGAR